MPTVTPSQKTSEMHSFERIAAMARKIMRAELAGKAIVAMFWRLRLGFAHGYHEARFGPLGHN